MSTVTLFTDSSKEKASWGEKGVEDGGEVEMESDVVCLMAAGVGWSSHPVLLAASVDVGGVDANPGKPLVV